jgi:hypothetical protein
VQFETIENASGGPLGIALRDQRTLSKLADQDERLDAVKGMYDRLRSDEGSQFLALAQVVI